MSRNPFVRASDQSTEFGFGPGHFPNPHIDYSEAGRKSGIPIADPDRPQQYLDLMAARRTDLGRTDVPATPGFRGGLRGDHEDYYTEGNTERFGANPPLVQQRRRPPPAKRVIVRRAHMERKW